MLKLMIPALLLSAFVPDAALAEQERPVAIHIAYHDLDLRSPAGVKQLDRRIEQAIAKVCPDTNETDLARKLVVIRCREAKRADVAGQRTRVLEYGARRTAGVAAISPAR